MAEVLNGERGGFYVHDVDTAHATTVTLNKQNIALNASDEPIAVAYEDLESVRIFRNSTASPVTDDGVMISNHGQTALVAKVGSTRPEEVAVKRADYSMFTRVTTPSERRFTREQLRQGITFEAMEKPVAESLDAIHLQVGDIYPLSLEGLFSGKFRDKTNPLRGVDASKIAVWTPPGGGMVNISAIAAGTTTFQILSTNPAGSTPIDVEVIITPR